MASAKEIRQYCDAIARSFTPEKIIIFGSHAHGKPHEDSDVDVFVLMRHTRRLGRRPSLTIRRKIQAGFPVDIVVKEPREFARRLREGDSFLSEVAEKGRVMYEASHA